MKLQNKFTIARPIDEVWSFFHDIDAVADCLPGANYEGLDDAGHHKGNMSVKIGPFQTKFDGSADVTYDESAKAVSMSGQGLDKRGGNRGKMTMDCRLGETDGQTEVTVDSNIQMSGTIAQFGRSGIIEEIAKVLISDFVANAQDRMGGRIETPAVPVDTPVELAEETTSSFTSATQDQQSAANSARNANSVSAGSILWRMFVGWLKSPFKRS